MAYPAENAPCLEQLQVNKRRINHLIDSGLTERDHGNLESAAATLFTASAETVFVQLQRLYLNPEFEEDTRGQFRAFRESLEQDLKKIAKECEAKQDTGDNVAE